MAWPLMHHKRLAVGGDPRGADDPLRGDAGRETAGGMPGQPATIHGAEMTEDGMPSSVTRGLGTGGMAWPPCMHSTVAPCCMRNPGMSDHLHSALVDGHGGAGHRDGRALAVADDDSGVGDRDEGAG